MALDVELYRRTIHSKPTGDETGTRRISVIDIGSEATARTLVFLHGFGGSATQWVHQLQTFGSVHDLRVIAPDLRGHGLSDNPPGSNFNFSDMVDDLELVLTTLEVKSPFYLIAHSFGGVVATEYALCHPERLQGLVLLGVPSRFLLRRPLSLALHVPDPLFGWLAKRLRVSLFAPQRTLKYMNDNLMAAWRGSERLPLVQVPTLVIIGHRDVVFLRKSYEDVPRLIKGAQHSIIPVSAHLVQLERPDAVSRAIQRFIDPRSQDPAYLKAQSTARAANLVQKLIEKPWLQHYDRDVPEQLPPSQLLVTELLYNASYDFGSHSALIFFNQKISYRELNLLCNRFANALRRLGIRKGDRVAIVLPNIPQCVISFYGTLMMGGVVVLGSPLSSEQEIQYQLHDSGARLVLTLTSYRRLIERACQETDVEQIVYTDVREYLPLFTRLRLASLVEDSQPHQLIATSASSSEDSHLAKSTRHLPTHSFQALLRAQSSVFLERIVESGDLALIQYTGGTTDLPKGVMLTHANLLANVSQVRHWMPDARRGSEVILGALPLSHSYGVTGCLNFSVGVAGTLVLMPTVRTGQILHAIQKYKPTIFPGVPGFYLAIANFPHVRRYGISSIRTCISGSAPLPVEVQEAFEKLTRGHLLEGYGLTEASPVTHANPLAGERHVGSIGIPLPSTEAKIIDSDTGETLETAELGELLIRGPQVMQGYWHQRAETDQTLKDGWLHTGDLARMDEEGFFTLVDRKKDLILSGSYNVYPRDVEEILYEHPKVLEAVVVGASSRAGWGNSSLPAGNLATSPFVKAVVVLKRGERATADELLAFCRERLDAYKVPRQIEFRNELPKNVVGKVLRRLLVEN